MSEYEQMRLRFIAITKFDVSKLNYPQPFCNKLLDCTNCMAYAFGFKRPDPGCDYYFPGGISRGSVLLKEEVLVESTIADLKLLGISCEKISEEEARKRTQSGKQIVALFYLKNDEGVNFHFIRKDKEGGWSHKPNFFGPPSKIDFNYETTFRSDFKLIAYLSASLN